MKFLGFERPDGSVGIRDYVLILPGGFLGTNICHFVEGAKTMVTSDTVTGHTGRDRETIARTWIGLGRILMLLP